MYSSEDHVIHVLPCREWRGEHAGDWGGGGSGAGRRNQLAKPTCVWIQGCGSFYYIHRIRRSSHQYKVHVDGPIPSSRRIDNRRPCPRPSGAASALCSVYLGLLRLSAYTVVRVATSARSAELLIRADHAPSGARAEAAGGAGVAVPMLPFRVCRLSLPVRTSRGASARRGAPPAARREGRGARIWRQYIQSSQNAPAARWAQFTVLQGTTVYCARRIAMASAIGEIGRHVHVHTPLLRKLRSTI